MRIYEYFKKPTDEERVILKNIEEKYQVYAITNSKKIAKRFEEQRNMKKFIKIVHKNMTKEEYTTLCNQERGAVLEEHTLTTVIGKIKILDLSESVNVLMTYFEYMSIKEVSLPLDDEVWWEDMPFPFILKDKYINALNTLQYVCYYKLMRAPYLPDFMCQILDDNTDDDYAGPSLSIDELSYFISFIRETL